MASNRFIIFANTNRIAVFGNEELEVVLNDNGYILNKKNPTLTTQIDYRITVDIDDRITATGDTRITYQ